jgi:hypothetical protein
VQIFYFKSLGHPGQGFLFPNQTHKEDIGRFVCRNVIRLRQAEGCVLIYHGDFVSRGKRGLGDRGRDEWGCSVKRFNTAPWCW